MNLLKKAYYKLRIDTIYHKCMSEGVRLFWKPYHIMDVEEMISYIVKQRCSVARFGDCELHIAAYGCPLKFQRGDKRLQKKLNDVIKNKNPKLLLCLPNRVNAVTKAEREKLSPFWQKALKEHLYPWTKNFPRDRVYGDTNISRLTGCGSESDQFERIEKIKRIWKNRNVIMLEGEKTRFGVGNSLFDDVESVQRILGPAESAFDRYSELYNACVELTKKTEDPLVLLALGPTATVLASDLADANIQAIDIGHLDISYEKSLRGTEDKIPGKYTNEADGGSIVDDCMNESYLSQIVCRILT